MTSNDNNVFYLNAVTNITDNKDPWFVSIPVNDCTVKFKVNTEADVTILTKQTNDLLPNKPMLSKADILLISVNSEVTAYGYFVNTAHDNNDYSLNCYVADTRSNLLSKGAVEQMVVIGAVSNVTLVVIKGDPATIKLRDDIKPTCIYAPRRIPFPMLDKVNNELDRMINEGIIRSVMQPTD